LVEIQKGLSASSCIWVLLTRFLLYLRAIVKRRIRRGRTQNTQSKGNEMPVTGV